MAKKNIEIIFLSLVVLAGGANLVSADESPLTCKLDNRYLFESKVNNADGKVQLNESAFDLEYGDKVKGKLPVNLSLRMKHVALDETVAVELPARLEGRSIGFGVKFPAPFIDRDDFFVGVDVSPSLYSDNWEWENSAFRVPFRSYLIYKSSEQLILVGGVSVKIKYDTPVFPIIGLIYKPNDRLAFNLASEDPNISYKLTDKFTLFGEFSYTMDEYEVTRGTDKNVVLKYQEKTGGAGIRYLLKKNFEISLSGGGVGGRRLEYADDNGKIVPKSTAYARVAGNLKF